VRRRLSYANVAATLALVFSMTSGALAAKRYLINSTRQINPRVLKALKGRAGPKGATGVPGAPGVAGGQGPMGEPGPSHAYGAEAPGTAAVNVPAGSYAVAASGSFTIAGGGTKPGGGRCVLEAPGVAQIRVTTVPNTGEEYAPEKVVHGAAMISNYATVVMKAPGTIKEHCGESGESQQGLAAVEASILATLVGGVN
jgi:hypothetical protein